MTINTFNGTDEQQALVEEIHRLLMAQGVLFALDAPIRQSLANLAEYLAPRYNSTPEKFAATIDAALRANSELFTREEVDGAVMFVTSRLGSYVPRNDADTHSFKVRLYEPENPLPIDDISVVVSTSRPSITTVEPVFISDYWQIQAGHTPAPVADLQEAAPPVFTTSSSPQVEELATEADAPLVEDAAVTLDEQLEVESVEVQQVEEAVADIGAASTTLLTINDSLSIDLSRSVAEIVGEHGATLRALLAEKIAQDPVRRIASFGQHYYPENSVASMGKNDMRRIREYILEIGEPLLDTAIIADLYYHNPRQGDYEGFRFSLNYRLSREKDFEFVGVEGARLWSTKGLATIGTKRVKASEMAQITSYLVDGFDDSLDQQSAETIEQSGTDQRLLTFFEWEYGVLPLDASLAALLPRPMLPDQRSVVLRFESPQHYTNHLVEVRYPTSNRGGWLQGLEDFFHEHLVPGALLTISRTAEPNVFALSYEEASETTERLLTLDEKKNKFAFVNVTFYAAVDSDYLLTQQKHGRLRNLKSLPMNDRRKAESVLEHVFETVGEQLGSRSEPRYRSSIDELLLGYTVLRPGSRSLLKQLLQDGEDYEADETTPGVYYFMPEPKADDEDEDEDEDEDGDDRISTRGRYNRYEDDE
jgi:hypothetical protein